MDDDTGNAMDNVAAFQKMWIDTMSKLAIAGLSVTPGSPPPEYARQMRSGVFKALEESWDQFLRSPQFMETMKQSMDSAVAMRKMSKDFLNKAHHEMQGAAKDDIDSIMLSVRHLETRILDRQEELEKAIQETQSRIDGIVENQGTLEDMLTTVAGRIDDILEALKGAERKTPVTKKTAPRKTTKKAPGKTASKATKKAKKKVVRKITRKRSAK